MVSIIICSCLSLTMGQPADSSDKLLAKQVEAFLTEPDYSTIRQIAEEWRMSPPTVQARIADMLTKKLGSLEKPGLTEPQALKIPYRIEKGDLKDGAEGYTVFQDVFIEGGRAAWGIEELSGIRLPEINEGLGEEERTRRVRAITDYVANYHRVLSYLDENDYKVLSKYLHDWKQRPVADRAKLVELLGGHLRVTRNTGLKNNDELLTLSKLAPGDLRLKSWKKHTQQDVFIVGGKAAWAIEELIGFRLPKITEDQSPEQRIEQAYLITSIAIPAFVAGVKQAALHK